MSDNTGLGVFWVLLCTIPFICGQICVVYWIFANIKKMTNLKKYAKSLVNLNWAAIIVFELALVLSWYETLRKLIIGADFAKGIQDTPDLQWPFLLSSVFYLIGKWIVYVILYKRLAITLSKSAYAYSDRTYFKLKLAIGVEVGITFLALIFAIMADDGPLFFLTLILAVFYFLLDIGIPIALNIMFIKKTYQVGKTYYRIVSMSKGSRSQSPPFTTDSDNRKFSTIKHQPSQDQSQSGVSNTEDVKGTGSTNLEINNNNNNENGTNDDQSIGAGVDIDDGRKQSVNISSESEQDLNDLFEAISRVSVLSIIIAISSILYFPIYMASTVVPAFDPAGFIGVCYDSFANMICLVLAFEFATKWFDILCGSCQQCCKKRIARKADQDITVT